MFVNAHNDERKSFMNYSDFIMVLGLIVVVALLALCYAGYLFNSIYHIDRGYENLDGKLQALGAKIWRETI